MSTPVAVKYAPDADQAMCMHRENRFTVRAELTRDPDFVGEKTVYISHNGRQEYASSFAPHEARKLYDLLAAEFGFQQEGA